MQVFKFGGASINTTDRIINVGEIIKQHSAEGLFVIVSAMGKTTNALEAVVNAFFAGRSSEALQLFEQVKTQHNEVMQSLVKAGWHEAQNRLKDFYTEAEWILHDKPVQSYDYYYDQLVCLGELLSTTILHYYLTEIKLDSTWFDVRDIMRTDNNFRDASVDFETTGKQVENLVKPALAPGKIVITQGFIGATDENESTTLGREGSDYSAAIFANLLNAENQTIWKDVEAVMNADPKEFSDAVKLDNLSFAEVIEMAYYGAQVIHPKTIKPLQNKNIPLLVKSFIDPSLPGTVIGPKGLQKLPPIYVVKNNQVFIQFLTKDFSFVGGEKREELSQMFEQVKMLPGISQNTAIGLLCAFDDKEERIQALALKASENFDVTVERNLSLITVRHYTQEAIDRMTAGMEPVLIQKTPETYQALVKKLPIAPEKQTAI